MTPQENRGEIVIYRTADNQVQLDVQMDKDTVWLTQDQMAQLFDRDRTVISRHIRNIFKEGELDESLVCAKFAQPKKYGRREGYEQEIIASIYNLDVIISVGYRVNSKRGVEFRQWATKKLKDYLVKGYVINERLRHEQLAELRQLVQIVGRTSQSTPPRCPHPYDCRKPHRRKGYTRYSKRATGSFVGNRVCSRFAPYTAICLQVKVVVNLINQDNE